MKNDHDVVIAGLGVMGSAAAWQLARRGSRVLGVDRYAPPHTLGSSHGETRVIREVYFEHPLYVPLVRRAWGMWESLEGASGRTLLQTTGLVTAGPPEGDIVRGTLASAAANGMSHELLDAAEAHARFPVFTPSDDMVALFEPRAGVLHAEACVRALLDAAARDGAELRYGTCVTGWREDGDGVVVETDAGAIRAGRLVLATGPWINQLMAGALPVRVTRQPFHWFAPVCDDASLSVDRCPVTLWEFEPGRCLYTLPDAGGGFKAAIHHEGRPTDAEHVDRDVMDAERDYVRGLLERFIPGAAGSSRGDEVCLYTTTPDEHFVIDTHPSSPRVVVASPCSGHGFKFAPVVGEAIADLATDATPAIDLTPFRVSRFT